MSNLKQCLAFCSVALWLLEVHAGEVKVIHDTQSWPAARKACRAQGRLGSCDLITKKRLTEEWSKLDLSGEKKFWVGGRRFHHWLWEDGKGGTVRLFKEHGCYTLTVEKSKLRQPRLNSPYQCYSDCDSKSFIYLQGENCYCSDTLEGEAAPQDKCHLACEGSDDKCGGEQALFSLYSIPKEITFKDGRKDRLCASCQIRDNRFKVDSTDCTSSRQYFCQADNQASQVESRSTSYRNAINLCQTRYNSTLLFPSFRQGEGEGVGQLLTDLQAVSDKMSASFFTTFWLPLRRHVRAVWLDGEKGEEGGESGYCLSATPLDANYSLSDLHCSHSYGSICDCSGSVNPGNDGSSKEGKSTATRVIIIVVVAIILVIAAVAAVLIFKFRARAMAKAREIRM